MVKWRHNSIKQTDCGSRPTEQSPFTKSPQHNSIPYHRRPGHLGHNLTAKKGWQNSEQGVLKPKSTIYMSTVSNNNDNDNNIVLFFLFFFVLFFSRYCGFGGRLIYYIILVFYMMASQSTYCLLRMTQYLRYRGLLENTHYSATIKHKQDQCKCEKIQLFVGISSCRAFSDALTISPVNFGLSSRVDQPRATLRTWDCVLSCDWQILVLWCSNNNMLNINITI